MGALRTLGAEGRLRAQPERLRSVSTSRVLPGDLCGLSLNRRALRPYPIAMLHSW